MNYSLHQKGYENAVVKFVEKMYTRQFNIWASEGEYDKICHDENFVSMCKRLQCKDTGYFLITFNPEGDFSPNIWQDLHALASYLCTLKLFQGNVWWVLEQRSETASSPKGPHMHMFVEAGASKKSDILKRCMSSFSKKIPSYKCNIDVRPRPEETLQYIKGHKADPKKQSKVDTDTLLRDHYGYAHWYQKSDMDL